MRILITSAKENCSFEIAFLLKEHQLFFGDENIPNHQFPTAKSESFVHELLSFCLDFEIEKIFPIRNGELSALISAKILFKEFGIEIVAPDILSDFIDNKKSFQVDSFNQLSSQLISLGYPNQKFAVTQADKVGNLVVINDQKKDFNDLWSNIHEISFVQIGKLFNQSEFQPLVIYPISGDLQILYVLFDNNLLSLTQKLSDKLFDDISSQLIKIKSKGVYQIYINENKILRIKNVAY